MEKRFFVSKINLKMILFIAPFFRPESIALIYANTLIDRAFIFCRITSFLIIFIKYFTELKKPIRTGFILVVIYEVIIIFSAILNKGSINERIVDMGNALGIYMIFSYFDEKYPQRIIDASFKYISILIGINALLSLVFPHGLNHSVSDSGRINFLGVDNFTSCYFIFSILLSILYIHKYPNKKIPYVMIGIVFLNEIYYFSGAGFIAVLSFILLIVLFCKNDNNKIFYNPWLILIGFGVIEFLLVFLQNVNWMGFVFKFLGKSSTFSDRFFYWNHAITQFLKSPIIGLGSGIVDLWNNNYYSHNALLDVLIKGGILGAFFWIIKFLIPLKKLWGKSSQDKMARSICLALIPFLLIGLMEGLEDRIVFNAYIALAFSNEYIISHCHYKIKEKNYSLNLGSDNYDKYNYPSV